MTIAWLFSRYAGVVVWDFEYREDANCRQLPVSATFLELKSGRRVELWEEFGTWPPFPTTPDWLWVSYHASAETKCHLVLNWPIPETVLDLEAEFRCETTNHTVLNTEGKPSKKLPDAMREYGLAWSDLIEKPAMVKLILHGWPYSEDDRRRILEYNWLDTDGLAVLLPRVLPDIFSRPDGWALTLARGYYSGHCVAHMEDTGTPLDTEMYGRFDRHWDAIRARMVAQYDPEFGVYDGLRFVTEKFVDYLLREGIPWPTHESGIIDLREKTFQDMGRTYPQIERLRQIRMTMAKMRLSSIKMGADGRNRTMLGQFVASTGRNAPKASEFIFGPSRWLRGLIKPTHGSILCYLDWSAQEFVIAAALSGDQNMLAAIASGDPYIWFAKVARLVPEWATEDTHAAIRNMCKACCLGVLCGMGVQALAIRIGRSDLEARELLEHHRQIFPTFWAWSKRVVREANWFGHIDLAFGWRIHDGPKTKPPTLMNAPVQGNAAEMMRLAAVFAHRAGVTVNCPVHDAFMIEARAEDEQDAIATMRRCMSRASAAVLEGVEIKVKAHPVRWPHRYMDDREGVQEMWDAAVGHLEAVEWAA